MAVPSDALWESKVRFEIIPVKIAEWSAEKNGLRIGMRVVGGEWSVGGKVRIEMWLHNAGAKDVSFNANPGRADVGLTVAAVDSEGEERWAENGNVIIIAIPMRCTLPAGFVAKVKEFEVSFDAPDNKELAWIAPKFRDLKPGNYRLRCTWADAHPTVSGAGDWTGALATPEFDFMLGGLDDLKPAAALNGLPEDVIPELTRQSNDKYSAVACQSEKHVNFVLVYPGAISTGLSETSLDANGKWSIEGNIHLVDLAKTKAAGKNVDKRVIALKYTSGAPNTLFLDGKAYDLARRSSATLTAMLDMPGRVFMLRDEGEPFQTHRILALRSEKDLETVGKFAAHDMFMAQTYADSRRVRRMKGYVLSWDTQRPIQHSDGEHVAQLRIFPDGRVLSLSNGRRLKEFKIPAAALAELLRWLVEEGGVGEWKPIKMKIAGTGQEVEIPRVGNHWDQATEMLYFTRNGKRYGSVVESGSPGAEAFNAIRKRLREVSPKSAAAAAKPAADGYAKSGVPVADLNIPLTWSAEQNGLCLGMHIPEDANWRIGGEVKVELWVCNPGDKDVRFQWTDRRDVGIRMKLKDANGKDHDTEKWLMMVGRPNFIPTRLPAGHVMKVKEFSVKLLSHRDADDLRFIGEPRFKLPAGDYKFRCEVDLPGLGAKVLDGEWSGALKTGEIEVKLVAADAPGAKAGAKPERVKFPDEHYTKDGFPLEDLDGEGVTWNADENGLSLGYRVTGDEWRILGKDLKVELWVRNSGKEDVKFQILRRTDEGLRVKLTGADGKTHVATVVPTDNWLVGMKHHLSPGQCIKVNEFSVGLLPPDQSGQTGNELHFFVPPGWYKFVCEVEVPGFSATRTDGRQTVPGAGEWTGTLATRGLNLEVLAPSAPAPKPRIEWARVNVRKNGEVSLDRKKVTLDELRMRAAEDRAKRFVIYADGDVAYAKVTKVVEVLKAAGVTDFSLSKARVGDGKYRVANRSGSYEFDGKRKFSMCRPSEHPQWFTVMWPAEGDRPKCWLRTYPNVNAEHGGKWAVVWEPGTDVLWWVDDTDVGKMTATDPVHVIVEREGRKNNFSRDFGLPEGVKTEFRRLGFEIGRDKTPGLENVIGGNTGGQRIVSAEFGSWSIKGTVTDVDGKPLANVPVRVTTNQELKTVTTDEKGNYRVYFTLPLRLLANWRGVKAEPILEGFTERDMTMSGEFNVLLHAGEQPQRVRLAGEGNFKPGPIPRFGERDLLPSPPAVTPGKPGRADFVMLKAGEISGEIVTDDGKPAPPHFIAAATSEQRPGYNLAIVKSDAQGRFRLKGIPANKPVVFTVNPDGKPFETTKSSAAKFEPAGTHKIRIVLPSGRDANRALKVERVDDGAR